MLRLLAAPLPDELYLRLRYRAAYGRWPNIASPTDINEYILGQMLSSNDPLMAETCDKWRARAYVKDRVGEQYLTELYLHASDITEIQTARLPPTFVMKPSHASGAVRIVNDAGRTTDRALQAEARRWLRLDHYRRGREWVYKGLPKAILIEQNLSVDGVVPHDYKLYIHKGRCFLLHVDTDRFSQHQRAFFDRAWNRVPVTWNYPEAGDVPRPHRLEEMLEIAERLAAPFSFVRVDLYEVGGRVFFGELTHFPAAGHGCPPASARAIFAMMQAR